MNINESKLKKELRDAIIDCGFIAQVILDDLPDIDRVELLEMAVRGMLAYSVGFIEIEDKSGDANWLKSEMIDSLKEFRYYVKVADYDRKKFVDDRLEEVLGNQWNN